MIDILVVDDDDDILEGYRSILPFIIQAPTKVITSTNGENALKLLSKQEKIDIIFSDLNMPVMNGLEFIKNVRQNSKYESYAKSIIFMASAHGEKELVQKAIALGANTYILKPFDIEMLKEALNPYDKLLNLRLI
jgi:CheY-like chemotaxis protein